MKIPKVWSRLAGFHRADTVADTWCAALVALGIALRLWQFLAGRALWVDEAMLALSIGSRSFTGLARPLDFDQMAPLPFLWLTKALTLLGGVNEFTLRLVALLGGIATLFATWRLARRVCSPAGMLAAVLLAVFCPGLIYYSNELKPYSIDALFAVLLAGAGITAIEEARLGRKFWLLVLVGVVATWVSVSAALVLAGVGGAWFLCSASRVRWRGSAVLAGSWGLSFALAYAMLYHRATDSAYMNRFWSGSYLDISSWEAFYWSKVIVLRSLWGVFVGPPPSQIGIPEIGMPLLGAVLAGASAVGIRAIIRAGRRDVAFVLVGPVVAYAAASFLHRYPMAARLVVFLAPMLIILVAEGIGAAAKRATASHPLAAGVVLSSFLPLLGLPEDGHWRLASVQWADTGEMFANLNRTRPRGEPTYVYFRGLPIWTYYTTNWRLPDTARIRELDSLAGPRGPAFESSEPQWPEDSGGVELGGESKVVVGLPNGIQYRYLGAYSDLSPAPGWAKREAARIRGAANPSIAVVFLHFIDRTHVALEAELAQAGGVPVSRFEGREALFVRYVFPVKGSVAERKMAPPIRR